MGSGYVDPRMGFPKARKPRTSPGQLALLARAVAHDGARTTSGAEYAMATTTLARNGWAWTEPALLPDGTPSTRTLVVHATPEGRALVEAHRSATHVAEQGTSFGPGTQAGTRRHYPLRSGGE